MLGFGALSATPISALPSGGVSPVISENVSDSFALSDSVSEFLDAVESSSDSLIFTDSAADAGISENVSDSLVLTDSVFELVGALESVSDSISLSDSVFISDISENVSDSISFSDSATNIVDFRALGFDAFSFAGRESTTTVYSSNNVVFESLILLDVNSSLLNGIDVCSDGISIFDEAFGYGAWSSIPSPDQSWVSIPAVSATWTRIPATSGTWTPVLTR